MEGIKINQNEPSLEKNVATCIKSNEPKFNSLSEIRQNILILASNFSFEDLEEVNFIVLLEFFEFYMFIVLISVYYHNVLYFSFHRK